MMSRIVKSTKNLETKEILFHEDFSSLDWKMDLYLTTSSTTFQNACAYDTNLFITESY
jgi:hypothetical protein